ncbi:MAG: hypothetical protein QNJ81_00715 [Acidimicrobiia bacterium]|nr:hypothetical protein [Acidimicrobiia bacterium]
MPAARWTATDALPGRDSPDAAEAPSGRVEAGTELTELERLGLWVRVETPDEHRYWVDGRRLEELAPTESPTVAEPAPAEPVSQPVPPPPVEPTAPLWAPTHTVPPEGLQAWAQPHPAGPVVANLAGGVELRVQERRADWAHVVAENGWQGWVDGRRLVAAPAPASPPPQAPASPPQQQQAVPAAPAAEGKPIPTKTISFSWRSGAAFAVLVTVFLPWLRLSYSFGSVDATDVPAAFLWSLDPDSSFPNMGTVMMVLAAAVLATEFADRFKPYRKYAAWATVGVAALYLIQTYRFFLDFEGTFTTAFSTMFTQGFAIGPWVALAAGIVLLVKQPEDEPASTSV